MPRVITTKQLQRPCPSCGAAAGQVCKSKNDGKPLAGWVHPARCRDRS